MVKTIREIAKETSIEIGQAFTVAKKAVKKRIRTPSRVSGRPALAFALVPEQYRIQRPRLVRKK